MTLCLKCGTDFKNVMPHLSIISYKCALLLICIDCWESSTVDERINYYRKLYEFWLYHRSPHHTWSQIQEVVKNESEMSKKE